MSLGDGFGGFSCADTLQGDFIRNGTRGFIDGDTNLDVVFANNFPRHMVCLGDGRGGGADIFKDGFESGGTSAWAATVP